MRSFWKLPSQRNLILSLCFFVVLYAAWMPFYRATLRLEIKYNEGWNAYNAEAMASHSGIYPVRYGWTMANYPVLSFATLAGLGELTHDYLFTGRMLSLLSLLASCVLAAAIVRRLAGSSRAGLLAGLLCLTVFCANADGYVGMNEPQMFAQIFFMAALYLYIAGGEGPVTLVLCALLIVIGGNVKHNLLDFPLAIAIDLGLRSRRRLALFVGALVGFAALALPMNIYLGGPHFVDQMLVPRRYTISRLLQSTWDYYMPLLIPMVAALVAAMQSWRVPQRRVLAILFACSFGLGVFFAGGDGVSINTFFSCTLTMAMLIGLFLHSCAGLETSPTPALRRLALAAPLALFAWMLIPMASNDIFWPRENLRQLQAARQRYSEQVALLRSHPGPALCESILRCYDAGKPYFLDPFNATSLIEFGRLDENVLVQGIRHQQFAAIQFNRPPQPDGMPEPASERFTQGVLEAVRDHYRLARADKDCAIYVPAPPTELAHKIAPR
jgi:hypothetical protein